MRQFTCKPAGQATIRTARTQHQLQMQQQYRRHDAEELSSERDTMIETLFATSKEQMLIRV